MPEIPPFFAKGKNFLRGFQNLAGLTEKLEKEV
jgi:hypothetical protein